MDESLFVQSPATRQGGIEAIKRVMQHPQPPTGVFCYNDVVASGVMLGLKEQGIVPGKDVAVVGFDNIPESAVFSPSLTTIAAFPDRLGAKAADLLHRRMKGDEEEAKN